MNGHMLLENYFLSEQVNQCLMLLKLVKLTIFCHISARSNTVKASKLIETNFTWRMVLIFLSFLQCCPVLKPQIGGDPLFPGAVITNWSMVQSPIAPPTVKRIKIHVFSPELKRKLLRDYKFLCGCLLFFFCLIKKMFLEFTYPEHWRQL